MSGSKEDAVIVIIYDCPAIRLQAKQIIAFRTSSHDCLVYLKMDTVSKTTEEIATTYITCSSKTGQGGPSPSNTVRG